MPHVSATNTGGKSGLVCPNSTGLQAHLFVFASPAGDGRSFSRRNAIFLAPGSAAVDEQTVAYIATHEMGHVLTWAFLDPYPSRWHAYMAIRGLSASSNGPAAIHAERAREILAEDIRFLFGGPSASEFTPLYIFSLTLIALVGIVVQPHFIATGGGTAKSEDEARIGLVVGNFLKRLCTAGWALTALIALALLAGNAEIAANPDHVWGVAAREILGPLKMGLVGLMLACLMAAMMSSADCYMIVTSALVVKNIYAPYVNPNASEKRYVMVGRLTGLLIILGFVALTFVSRKRAWPAICSGILLGLAAGTRASAIVILPVVFLMLLLFPSLAPRSPLPAPARSAVFFALGAGLTLCLLFLPFAFRAPAAVWFALVEYHAGREVGGAVTALAYKAGFLSRVIQAYYPALGILGVALEKGVLGDEQHTA